MIPMKIRQQNEKVENLVIYSNSYHILIRKKRSKGKTSQATKNHRTLSKLLVLKDS